MAFKVGDAYRKNHLSLRPGGFSVFVKDWRGKVLEYDKIKNPQAYIRSLKRRDPEIQAWWE